MAYEFNADEIFEMAKQIERNGSKFYRDAAGGIGNAEEEKMLLELAEMEDDHEKRFAKMQSDLTPKEKEQNVFDPQGDAMQYLKALADHRVFFEKEIDTSSMRDILKAAITAEKDSIVFYLGMKDVVAESLGKERIDGIIKEEMSHITTLTRKLVALKR